MMQNIKKYTAVFTLLVVVLHIVNTPSTYAQEGSLS